MSIYHLSREELIRKIELDEQALKRAKSYKKEVEHLRKNLKGKTKVITKEVIKTVEVPVELIREVEVMPEGVCKEHLEAFQKVRRLL